MRPCARAMLIVSLLVFINGCALSSLTIASLAANGLSFAVSGKSLSDHFLSNATGNDCSLFRIVSGDRICLVGTQDVADEKTQEPTATVVTATILNDGATLARSRGATFTSTESNKASVATAQEEPSALELETGLAARTAHYSLLDPNQTLRKVAMIEPSRGAGPDVQVASTEPYQVAREIDRPQLFVVLGSFQDQANALRQHSVNGNSRITPAIVNGERYYRVVLGPFGDSITTLATASDSALHGAGRWPIWLCADSLSAPPCSLSLAQAPVME